MEIKGLPPWSFLIDAKRARNYYDLEYKPISIPDWYGQVKIPGSKSFVDLLGKENSVFADFLDKCTIWKP